MGLELLHKNNDAIGIGQEATIQGAPILFLPPQFLLLLFPPTLLQEKLVWWYGGYVTP